MAIADKLNDLITQRNNLAANLNTMGVSASNDETLTALVPKVLDIQTGGSSEITKGLIIKEVDENGYVIDAELVDMTEVPIGYFYSYSTNSYFGHLTNLKLPNNITKIVQYGFYNCRNLELNELPNTVYDIENYAFTNCEKISLTKIPDGVSRITQSTFSGCKNLSSLEIGSKLTYIATNAFQNCSNLTEVNILSNKSISIAGNAFNGCSKLSKLIFKNITSVPSLSNTSAFTSTAIKKGTGYIYVPDTLVTEMQSASNWSTLAAQIKPISELEG